MEILKEIEKIAEKILISDIKLDHRVQKALSEILIKARSTKEAHMDRQ